MICCYAFLIAPISRGDFSFVYFHDDAHFAQICPKTNACERKYEKVFNFFRSNAVLFLKKVV